MHRFSISTMTVAVAFLFISVVSSPVLADDVTDSINEALKQYNSGEFADAVQSLDYASQLIRQKKGGQLEAFLPKPISGWKAEDAKSQAIGSAMFGGGITAERSYVKGNSRVNVKIITDSPMMQVMSMMFSNPMMATSDGGKLEKISGEKAIVKYSNDNKDGNINMVIAGRFLITVEGNDVARQDLIAFAQGIDFKKLAAMP
ncbi:MAG: hypothetical protein AB9866_17615 [Syntrophobacteraceae bacterium]